MPNLPLATDELRRQTASLHEALDRLPLLGELMSPRLRTEDYREIISRMSACFESAESAVARHLSSRELDEWHYQTKVPALREDVRALNGIESPRHSLNLGSSAEAHGAIYVLMGSSLGGRFIAKNISRVLSIGPTEGAAFYSSAEGDQNRWSAFKNRLNKTYSGNPATLSGVIRGATKCFILFTKSFE